MEVKTKTYGISLKNLYRIRQRGYVSAGDKNGKVNTFKKEAVDNRICELERRKTQERGGFR